MMINENNVLLEITLPEHTAQVKTLGYACGMNSGMISPLYGGGMPPDGPVKARGPIRTNNPKQFMKMFREGHDQGFQFGAEASLELAETLNTLPFEYWWPVCMCFAGGIMGIEDNNELYTLSSYIKQGTDEFCKIYLKHHPE